MPHHGAPTTISFSRPERTVAGHRNRQHASTTYELVPAASLPFVDLSISVKSRFMTRRQLDTFDTFMRRYRRPLAFGYGLGVAVYPLTLVMPIAIANPLSISAVCLCAIPSVTLFSTLRFDIVTAMLGTFDFWLCTIVGWSTFFVLSVIVSDTTSRSIAVVIAMFGVQANIMIDANLREAHNWVWVNCIGVTVHLFVAAWASVCSIPQQQYFAVFKFGDHHVPSESFVSSGLVTVAALIARNVFRKHRAKTHDRGTRSRGRVVDNRTPLPIIEFVSYRTILKFEEREDNEIPVRKPPDNTLTHIPTSGPMVRTAWEGPATPRTSTRVASGQLYLQRLQYMNCVGSITANDTVIRTLFKKVIDDGNSSRLRTLCSLSFHVFGLASAVSSLLVGAISPQSTRPLGQHYTEQMPSGELCSLVGTVLYCGMFVGLYHRLVLRRIVVSFNFIFFSAQVTAAHLCVSDFFRWTPRCVSLVVTSWIWIHWVLMLDALTPVVRARVSFHVRLGAIVFTLSMCSAMMLIYELVFSSSAEGGFRDRVVWRGFVFNRQITFRISPFFYNCVVTVLALSLRLLWRLYTVQNDTLVVLDGAVVCNNYMSRRTVSRNTTRLTTRERSRRWGSMWRQPPRTQSVVLPAPT